MSSTRIEKRIKTIVCAYRSKQGRMDRTGQRCLEKQHLIRMEAAIVTRNPPFPYAQLSSRLRFLPLTSNSCGACVSETKPTPNATSRRQNREVWNAIFYLTSIGGRHLSTQIMFLPSICFWTVQMAPRVTAPQRNYPSLMIGQT